MIFKRTWAWFIGIVSTITGILGFLSVIRIPAPDALIHICTGLLFIAGAWIKKGAHANVTIFWLGIFYIIFGTIELNRAHIIVGILSALVSLLIPPTIFRSPSLK